MKLAAATIASKNTLAHARVLAKSFGAHHPGIPFFVLLADEIEEHFDPMLEPFTLLHLHQLAIPDVRRFSFRYSQQELTYATTPWLIVHLLGRFDAVAFFKQESFVMAPLHETLALMSNHAIVLTPHLLGPVGTRRELNILQSGVYNVGFLGVANTNTGRTFLDWWKDRLSLHCVHDVPVGLHYEQRWLDLVPAYFDDYCIVDDPRFNVAHWNLLERKSLAPSYIRFSGLDPERSERVTRYTQLPRMSDIGEAALLFRDYAKRLRDAGYDECRTWPYAYARFDDGILIPDAARAAYRALSPSIDPWSPECRIWFERYERERHSFRSLLQRAVNVWKRRRAEKGFWFALRVVTAAAWRHAASRRAALLHSDARHSAR